jgi:hypothetical protein
MDDVLFRFFAPNSFKDELSPRRRSHGSVLRLALPALDVCGRCAADLRGIANLGRLLHLVLNASRRVLRRIVHRLSHRGSGQERNRSYCNRELGHFVISGWRRLYRANEGALMMFQPASPPSRYCNPAGPHRRV